MFTIFKKELFSFFASEIGYLVIGVFVVCNGLFLWVFKGSQNILDAGFADLISFFEFTPWVLLFLSPAISMKSFSEEKKHGTLELLVTKPITLRRIVLGKFFAVFCLSAITIFSASIYVVAIWNLGNPVGNIPIGSTLGSFCGLLFLAGNFAAIGVFTSTLSENQIVAFVAALFISFFLFYGLEGVASLNLIPLFLETLSLKYHFSSISRGVLDTRDALYFLSIMLLFLYLTELNLKRIFY